MQDVASFRQRPLYIMRRHSHSMLPGPFANSVPPTQAIRVSATMRKRACWTILAALSMLVESTVQASAGEILTYTFTTDAVMQGEAISGSFQVDSSHFQLGIDTDISSFITNLSFEGGGSSCTIRASRIQTARRHGRPNGRSHQGIRLRHFPGIRSFAHS